MNSININVKGLELSEDKEAIEKAIADACKQVFVIAYKRGYSEAYEPAFKEGRQDKADELIEATANVRELMFEGRNDAKQH